jgi:nonsense-mediated mRNA decay protein 3
MPELKVYAKSTELETADVISQSSGEIQVMDPTNYSVKDILVPRDAVIGDSVKVVRIDGILYYVPQ